MKKEAYEEQDWEQFDSCLNANRGIYIAICIVNAGGVKAGGVNE